MAITQSTINHLLLTNLEKCIDNGTDSFIVMALTDWSFGIMLVSVGISFYVYKTQSYGKTFMLG